MKKSFLNATAPWITEMVQVPTPTQAIDKIQKAIKDGATAIGFQLSHLKKEFHSDETVKNIISSAGDIPVYYTNYRGGENEGKSDEELAEGLLKSVDFGVTLVDIMGDLFDPSPEELTTNPTAIEKQIKLIDSIHKKGGEVLMSSHVYEYRSVDRVLKIALEQQKRGADIVKIVTGANSQEEQIKNLDTCRVLKENLKVPFLFLSGGTHNYLHRTIGPSLGVCMWLCFREYDETTYPGPPLLSDVLKLKEGLKL